MADTGPQASNIPVPPSPLAKPAVQVPQQPKLPAPQSQEG